MARPVPYSPYGFQPGFAPPHLAPPEDNADAALARRLQAEEDAARFQRAHDESEAQIRQWEHYHQAQRRQQRLRRQQVLQLNSLARAKDGEAQKLLSELGQHDFARQHAAQALRLIEVEANGAPGSGELFLHASFTTFLNRVASLLLATLCMLGARLWHGAAHAPVAP